MKRLFVLSAVLLALGVPRLFGAGGSVEVLRVPEAFATIQTAVDAADQGDIIIVAPGTYCEQVVISTPDLRLRAAPAGGDNQTVLSGACGTGGYGFHVLGESAGEPVGGVEISGFVVEGFDSGIVLENATGALIHQNELRENQYHTGSATPAHGRSQGILLVGASFNDITQNRAHDNGHLGIGLVNGSNGNLVRGNRLARNRGPCSLMLWGTTNSGNRIVENEVTGPTGTGIMIGPSPQTGNLVAQNRIHGHLGRGISVLTGSYLNVIQQNDARGNGLNGLVTDLFDSDSTNVWQRNLGTCVPGNAGCE